MNTVMNNTFYNGTKLLSMRDINGDKPDLYLCTTNRSGGKTTYFSRYLVNRFLKHGEKFALLYRYNYELDSVAEQFFKDISRLFFPNYLMYSAKRSKGIYHELYIGENNGDNTHYMPCGYAISINSADQIKKRGHFFSDVSRILFDEFQSETNHYCDREIEKFISIHTSIARGKGEHARYVPVIMLSNTVSLINPYYIELGIAERLKADTKFLRGNGFVLEQGYIDSASKAQKESGFNRAFANNKYVAYSSENVYLNDSHSFIEKPIGKSRYLGTLKYKGNEYGIREYPEQGYLYCDDRIDNSFTYKIAITTADHDINYVMLKKNEFFLNNMRYYFEHGCFRFKDLKCKEALLKAISY